jgi:hypothetical protein
MDWKDATVKLPEEPDLYLVTLLTIYGQKWCEIRYFNGEEFELDENEIYNDVKVTHWDKSPDPA